MRLKRKSRSKKRKLMRTDRSMRKPVKKMRIAKNVRKPKRSLRIKTRTWRRRWPNTWRLQKAHVLSAVAKRKKRAKTTS